MKKINIILVVIIILILGVLGYLGFKMWRGSVPNAPVESASVEKFEPVPIMNKGKESEERDAIMEADVRKIDMAVREYAQEHNGRYPMSYFKDPCQAVGYCLKGVNINEKDKIYLNPVPQTKPNNLDYHYTADNEKKIYCARTPHVLETANTMIFQCAPDGCGRVDVKEACQ